MTQRLEVEGRKDSGSKYEWDDGSDHDDVSKIYLQGGLDGIQFVKFEYIKNGKPKDGPFHGYSNTGFTHTFEIDHLKNEYLESVEGYYKTDTGVIQALQFKTNLRISELFGYEYGKRFTLAVDGKKIIGFHGFADHNLNGLGAYFTWITPNRTEVKGGNGGKAWDDGADYEGITKIHVRSGHKGILHIKFDYVNKDGHLVEGQVHGTLKGKGIPVEPFEINHTDKEYLLSVDGYYDETSGVIQSLQFKTNMRTSDLMGFDDDGTKFSLGCNNMKIVGFHGYADKNLNSLGVYLKTLPFTKLEYKGGDYGTLWDDGTFQGVRKVYVYYDASVRCIGFEYDNQGKVETRQHGSKVEIGGQEGEFVLDYPNEFITSIEGNFKKNINGTWITSLTFKTSKGKTSPTFGDVYGDDLTKFVLERKGCGFVGFHGRSSWYGIQSLGAYSHPMPPPPPDVKEEEAQDDDEESS